jgi:hypothetical protein
MGFPMYGCMGVSCKFSFKPIHWEKRRLLDWDVGNSWAWPRMTLGPYSYLPNDLVPRLVMVLVLSMVFPHRHVNLSQLHLHVGPPKAFFVRIPQQSEQFPGHFSIHSHPGVESGLVSKFLRKMGSSCKLVAGLEHEFYFSICWEVHHPNWRTHIFQRFIYFRAAFSPFRVQRSAISRSQVMGMVDGVAEVDWGRTNWAEKEWYGWFIEHEWWWQNSSISQFFW